MNKSNPYHPQACRDLSFRSRSASLLYLLVWFLILIATSVAIDWPAVSIAISLCFFITVIWRQYLISHFDETFNHRPIRWLQHYQVMVTLTVVAWSAMNTFMHWAYPLQWPAYLAGFSTAGFAAGGMITQSTHLNMQRRFLIIMLVPPALMSLFLGKYETLLLSFVYLLDLLFLLQLGKQLHEEYWRSLNNTALLVEQNWQLDEAKRRAEKADHAKTDFLASMSHELRTPLNAIIGFSEMITEEVLGAIGNDRYQEYMLDIHNSGHHLLHLVNDMLDLAKIEAGQLALYESDVNIDDLLISCLRMIKGRKEASSISFFYERPDDLPMVRVDERLLKQIVLNPLTNAVKYNQEGGTITLSAFVNTGNGISIVVADTGVGIAEEHMDLVMEPFSQVHADAHLSHEGTGLGLSLSKQLIELHDGTLELESEIGKGTTVTICLPAERIIRS